MKSLYLVPFLLAPGCGHLPSLAISEPLAGASAAREPKPGVGSWLVRTIEVETPEDGRIVYATEMVYCPTENATMTPCRTGIIWSRTDTGLLGNESASARRVIAGAVTATTVSTTRSRASDATDKGDGNTVLADLVQQGLSGGTDLKCTTWQGCTDYGLCTAQDGKCVATDANCKKSKYCAKAGRCREVNGRCVE